MAITQIDSLAQLTRRITDLERENRALRAWIRLKVPMPPGRADQAPRAMWEDDQDQPAPVPPTPVPPDPTPAPDSPNPDDEEPEADVEPDPDPEPEREADPEPDPEQPETDQLDPLATPPGVPPGVPALGDLPALDDLLAATRLCLTTLANHDGLTLGELSKQTGLPKPEVVEILKTLRRQDRISVTGQRRGTRYHIAETE